jgi:hypothetical protein
LFILLWRIRFGRIMFARHYIWEMKRSLTWGSGPWKPELFRPSGISARPRLCARWGGGV